MIIGAGIGRLIKELREEQGLSQGAFAKMVGVTPSQISDYECERKESKLSTLVPVFKALGYDVSFSVTKCLETPDS